MSEAILVEVRLHQAPKGYPYMKALAWRGIQPNAYIGPEGMDANELYQHPPTITYEKSKVHTPAGDRWLYVNAEDKWIVDGLLEIGSKQLEEIHDQGYMDGLRFAAYALGVPAEGERLVLEFNWHHRNKIATP